MSPDTYAIADPISSALANEHCPLYADKPSEAKGMFTQRLYRSLGLAAQIHLRVGRYRDLIEIPAAIRQDPGGRKCFTPDDDDTCEYGDGNCHDLDTSSSLANTASKMWLGGVSLLMHEAPWAVWRRQLPLCGAPPQVVVPTPPHFALTFCAPHAHPLLPTAMTFVSYGFCIVQVRVLITVLMHDLAD
jgi:hypothetical protein